MNNQKFKTSIALICNIALIFMESIAAKLCFAKHGIGAFKFYTENSNFFAFFTCLIMVIYQIKYLSSGRPIPTWAKTLKYISVCCLTITFIVVITILIPLEGGTKRIYPMLFKGSSLYQHTLCPIIAFLSFVLFENKPSLPQKSPFLSMIPTLIYASIIMPLNALSILDGPYPFVRVHNQSFFITIIWCIVILAEAYLLALLIWKLDSKHSSNFDEKKFSA